MACERGTFLEGAGRERVRATTDIVEKWARARFCAGVSRYVSYKGLMNLLDALRKLWLNGPDQSRGFGSIISPSQPLLLLMEGGNEEKIHWLSSSNLPMLL